MKEKYIPEDWTWRDAEGIRFATPPDWSTVNADGAIAAAAAPRQSDEEFIPNVNIVLGRTPTPDVSIEDLAAVEFAALSDVLAELQAIDTEVLVLDGREWARTLMAYRGVEHPLTLEQRTTLNPGHPSIVVSATVDTNDWARLEDAVTIILDSVSLIAEEIE